MGDTKKKYEDIKVRNEPEPPKLSSNLNGCQIIRCLNISKFKITRVKKVHKEPLFLQFQNPVDFNIKIFP